MAPLKETIGDATLYLGDCLEVMADLEDGCADMVFTDPPYGHNNNDGDLISNWERALGVSAKEAAPRPIANDGPEANTLFPAALPAMKRLMKRGGCCCCGGGGGPDPQFARWSLWMDEIFDFKQMVVWDKGPIGMGWHYRRSYETVLVGQVPGAACRWFDDTNRVENIIRPGAHGIRKIIPSAAQHTTEKPAELAFHFIGLHSQDGDIVLDPFMGHGTTGEAAADAGRAFIGIEIEPKYFDIACRRIELAQAQTKLAI